MSDRAYWAYAISKHANATLVRCATHDDAVEEKERMKHSDAVTVGTTRRKLTEDQIIKVTHANGFRISTIR